MKKNVFAWLPAQIENWTEKGQPRLRISYWQTNPDTGVRVRFRPTFGLNRRRIIQSKLQKELAESYVQLINAVLPLGYPYKVDLEGNPVGSKKKRGRVVSTLVQSRELTPVLEALDVAEKIKCNTERYQTVKTYRSTIGQLRAFIRKEGLVALPVGDFNPVLALRYMDDSAARGIGNNTYNNIIRNCRAVFSCLVERGYLEENPFRKIKPKRKHTKVRRRFCPEDRDRVAAYYREHHPWQYYGILLQYFCLVRPIEICRLQFQHFDLEEGIIRMPCEITKSWKDGFPTIPRSILSYFTSKAFQKHPGSWYLFDNKLRPGIPRSNASIRRRRMNDLHRKILDKLDRQGLLKNRKGLSWYSWSDTGLDDRRREGFNIFDLKELKRHESVTTTEMYLHHDQINKAVLGVPNVLEGHQTESGASER